MNDRIKYKNQILIVEDEFINREILRNMLEEKYDLIYASNGIEALEQIKHNINTLSLILLDIFIPILDGLSVLKEIKKDVVMEKIPVIVITSDKHLEAQAINLGAYDFISKPYPDKSVIMARVNRIIELYEDRKLISDTERDSLTKLFNKEYFYEYIEKMDLYRSEDMDAIIVDISRFHIINARFGFDFGAEVLKTVAKRLKEIVEKLGGLVCRKEADTFYIYTPHINDYKKFLDDIYQDLFDDDVKIKFKLGIYSNVDKKLNISKRFDQAQFALNNIKQDEGLNIGFYDTALYETEIFNASLLDDFDEALKNDEFVVYYQPKFNIQADTPYLASAEALIRWNHSRLGFLPPDKFIPLFEKNGLIQRLDDFIWNDVGKQIKKWKDEFNKVVPVSVNVSRIDIYDPNLVSTFENIIKENELNHKELMIEITESAYVNDANLIISKVSELRDLGFIIEMDDFGTGYSSLNMIQEMPIDVLKIDMSFIRQAFKKKKDTKIIELLINLANSMNMKVVTEGVETKEQVDVLKDLGCDIAQGYYFSKPLPVKEFNKFLE